MSRTELDIATAPEVIRAALHPIRASLTISDAENRITLRLPDYGNWRFPQRIDLVGGMFGCPRRLFTILGSLRVDLRKAGIVFTNSLPDS